MLEEKENKFSRIVISTVKSIGRNYRAIDKKRKDLESKKVAFLKNYEESMIKLAEESAAIDQSIELMSSGSTYEEVTGESKPIFIPKTDIIEEDTEEVSMNESIDTEVEESSDDLPFN